MNPLMLSDQPTSGVPRALDALRRGLDAIYGSRLSEVVIFGSCARGTADADSDVDVLVVLKDETNPAAEVRRTGQLVADISLEQDCVISCLFMKEEDFRHRQGPLLRNIRREGVAV